MKLTSLLMLLTIGCTVVSAQEWEQIASPPDNFLTDHSYGFGLNGKGYLVAGTESDQTTSANFYQYDPVEDSWARLEDFPGQQRGYAIGDTWNGKAYFGFGSPTLTRFLKDIWEYDPSSGQWRELTSCPCVPRQHPAFIVLDRKIFVGLGSGPVSDLKDWWIYDMENQTWTQGADFPSIERHHPYQFKIGDYIYAGFGHGITGIYNDWYRYDPIIDQWEQMASLPAEGRVAGTQFSHEGKGYILSGDGESHFAMDEGEFWRYSPDLDSWGQMPSHPGKSRWAPASFIIDNFVYLINGVVYTPGNPSDYQQNSYRFDVSSDVLSSTGDLKFGEEITIRPNPATDFIQIDVQNLHFNDRFVVNIFNTDGALVYVGKLTKSKLNITHLDSGMYFVELTDGDQLFTQQFIKY